MILALAILSPVRAHATASALAVDDQGVSNAPGTQLLINSTNTLNAAVSGNVGISSGANTLNVLSDGSINVNVPGLSVTGSTVQVTGLNGGPVEISGTANVSVSTVGIRGSQGQTITSTSTNDGSIALSVVDKSKPNLDGKSMVYASSNSMVTAGVLTLTGLGKSIDLQAFAGVCTFTINSGAQIQVAKNTSESYDLAYTLTNPSVTLVSQDVNSTCKVRIVGAN